MCLGHQVLMNTHEIVHLEAADRPDTWRNIMLLWLGKSSSKQVAVCRNRQISGRGKGAIGEAGCHDA